MGLGVHFQKTLDNITLLCNTMHYGKRKGNKKKIIGMR